MPDSSPSGSSGRVAAGCRRLFSIDLRTLALFRIGLALSVLIDLGTRVRDLTAHYTEAGVYPVRLLAEDGFGPLASWSLHVHLSGRPLLEAALFAVAACVALALLVGYRTRLASLLTWYLLFSLHVRNPRVSGGGDALLRVLAFWGILLPLAARCSVDALRHRLATGQLPLEQRVPPRVCSLATFAVLMQMLVLYVFSVLYKTGDMWWDGRAFGYAIRLDAFLHPAGRWLQAQTWLHAPITYGTMALEGLGPLLAFVPVWTAPLRLLAIALFVGFHLGISLCMAVGFFPYSTTLGWLLFLPPLFWDRLLPRVDPLLGGLPRRWGARLAAVGRRAVGRLGGRPLRVAPGPLASALAVLVLLYVVIESTLHLEQPWLRSREPPRVVRRTAERLWAPLAQAGRTLLLAQRWGMFAPEPHDADFWYVFVGHLRSGEKVDPFFGRERIEWRKPAQGAAVFPSQRWMIYLRNPPASDSPRARALSRWIVADWNGRHPPARHVVRLETYVHQQRNTDRGRERPLRFLIHATPAP